MKRRQRQWGLLGLLGLGGLLMAGFASAEDEEPNDDDGGDDYGPKGGEDDPPSGNDDPPTNDGPSDDDPPTNDGPTDDDPPTDEPTDDDDPPSDDPFGDLPLPPAPDGPPPKPPRAPLEPRPSTPDPAEDDDDPPSDDPRPPRAPTRRDGPPWSELLDPYPRGGVFYQVVKDDRFGGTNSTRSIAYRFLLSEAYLTAIEVGGMGHEDALTWAAAVGRQDKLRLAVIDLFQCSGWNDAMYGANPVAVSRASANGRSILLRPVHAPNYDLLEAGEPPVRNVTMGGNPADGSMRKFELLWCPAINRVLLWDSGGSAISTYEMAWEDGNSMENPPPWVMDLEIQDESGSLPGSFGCPGSDGELELGE